MPSENQFMDLNRESDPDAFEAKYTLDEFLFWAKDVGLVDLDYDDDGVTYWYFVGSEDEADEHACPECTKPHSPKWAVRLRAWLGLPRRR